jgi:hypothetical protein
MDNQLAALSASRRALCDIVLGTGRGSAQLAPHLDEAHLQVDSLISKGVRCGAHIALTSVGSHYGIIDFDVVGREYASRRSKGDVLAIGNATA